MQKILLSFLLVAAPVFGSSSSWNPEGVTVKSTDQAEGLILKADGNGQSVWDSVLGNGDVLGGSESIDNSIVTANGATGKAIRGPKGGDATNYVKADFTNTGEQFYLHGDLNGALSYVVHNTNSGSSSRAIISLGTDIGVNVFSIQSVSSNWPLFPSTAMWASHFTNGSVINNSSQYAPIRFVQNQHVVMAIEGSALEEGVDGRVRFDGRSSTEHVYIDGNSSLYFKGDRNVNGTTYAEFKNSNAGSSSYSEVDVKGNAGTLMLGHSSNGVLGSWIRGDQAYIVANNAAGIMIGTQNPSAPIRFIMGGTSPGDEVMKLSAGKINMQLVDYANDAAAGSAGLVTGDLYQTSGSVKIKQ